MQASSYNFPHLVNSILHKPTSISSLAYFRIAFGALVLISTLRFIILGWVQNQYLDPTYHFTYYGFDWIQPYNNALIYGIFGILLISAIGVLLGYFYRISSILLFLSFTYIELLDKSYYLNHYYFVSVVAFMLIFLPAQKNYSLDSRLNRVKAIESIPNWMILLLQLQIAIVYIAAGIAKINPDWLFDALPLKIWLPAKNSLPIIGPLFTFDWIPYAFSFFGMLFDCTIPFFLWWKRTRIVAYLAVVVFHLLTGILFQIGVFPLVMIALTPIFFDQETHNRILKPFKNAVILKSYSPKPILQWLFGTHLLFQLLLPFQPLLYSGNMFWTEEGYRFGWRVMLAEKAGTATFFIRETGANANTEKSIINSEYLNLHQEKQMAFQPDMILQYAHHLEKTMIQKYGYVNPSIRCETYVSLNGASSKLLIDPSTDLTMQKRGYAKKTWILSNK